MIGNLLKKLKYLVFTTDLSTFDGDNAVKYEQLGEALSGMLEMLKVSGLMPND